MPHMECYVTHFTWNGAMPFTANDIPKPDSLVTWSRMLFLSESV